MAARIDTRFQIPPYATHRDGVLDLLGGVVSLRRKESDSLLSELERQARQNHLPSQVELAWRLLSAPPSQRNNRFAVKWLKKAIAQDDHTAQYLMGILLARGQGVRRNPQEAEAFLTKAALFGIADAQSDLAQAKLLGLCGEPDPAGALYWYRLAGAQDRPLAAKKAGEMYRDAIGTPKDLTQASRWLKKAASLGEANAAKALALLYLQTDNPQHNESEARYWMKEAALAGDIEAQYRLGIYYWSGRGGEVNLREAIGWLSRAAGAANSNALMMLAGLYLTGNALTLNRARALALNRMAASLGNHAAEQTAQTLQSTLTPIELEEARALQATYPSPDKLVAALIPKEIR